jgi:hypothetical protein
MPFLHHARDTVAIEAPKGWTRGRRQRMLQEDSSGIRDRGLKGHLLPGSKRAVNKTVRKTELLPANLDRLALYEGNAWDRWEQLDSNLHENQTTGKECETKQPSEKKKWCYACRPFGTNSLKEGTV